LFHSDLERNPGVNARILLVEDEELIGTMVRLNLEGAGYSVAWIRNGAEAARAVEKGFFDLILLDIGLPGMDGLSVLKRIRRSGIGTPVMMLTARGDIPVKVEALGTGADDYLPKPFDVAELMARVSALVRRARSDREIPSDNIARIGGFEINLETRKAATTSGETTLSEKEVALVRMMVRSRGKVLKRSDILEEVWGMDAFPTERTVDNFIVRLRRLFEPDPESPVHFVTVRGEGYRFVE
jgi:DNA-binding response OmpR family regulator